MWGMGSLIPRAGSLSLCGAWTFSLCSAQPSSTCVRAKPLFRDGTGKRVDLGLRAIHDGASRAESRGGAGWGVTTCLQGNRGLGCSGLAHTSGTGHTTHLDSDSPRGFWSPKVAAPTGLLAPQPGSQEVTRGRFLSRGCRPSGKGGCAGD